MKFVQWEQICPMPTDRRTDMMKLTVYSQFCESRLKMTQLSQTKLLINNAAYNNEAVYRFGFFP